MFRLQRKRGLVGIAMSAAIALWLTAPQLQAKSWNPFAKPAVGVPETVSSTARPKFDGERPQFGAGKSWSSAPSNNQPGVFSRVGQGASRTMAKTKNALTLGKGKGTVTTVSKFPNHAGGYQSKPISSSGSSGGMLRRWLKPSAAPQSSSGPPATTNEFLQLKRPKF